ncbi:uncharacterized protein LOC134650273 [Cydia amplana]|uniref:uncharacterized protein LOC134650273 n=1 Tax=Cydia amplana TaxID=1869771 RepID=UPI002FE69C01
MNWRSAILKFAYRVKRYIAKRNKMKRRRESVALVYRKTTKFLSTNTGFLMRKMSNRRYRFLKRAQDGVDQRVDHNQNKQEKIDDKDFGERELDYYLGVSTTETFWRDPEGKEQIRKDFLLYHCGVTEEDYEKLYKRTVLKPSYVIQPRLKQVPFRIHRKKRNNQIKREGESWCEKTGIFKLFGNRRDSEISTSDSYSECESSEDVRGAGTKNDVFTNDMTKSLSALNLGDNEVC